ncbi:hypothetical protein BSQ40_14640 [Serratia fonticola]|nr:hypothetical protein BSQ40_14640 [Serratia fonticola]
MYENTFVRTVMPTAFCREDAAWIQERFSDLPPVQRGKIAIAYAEAYQEAFDAEPVSYRQENAARRAANKRLRVYVQTYSKANRGYTQPPPLAR